MTDQEFLQRYTGVTADSRKVQPGSIFVAIPGTHADGLAYVPAAIAAGATLIVGCTKPDRFPEHVRFLPDADPRTLHARLVRLFAGAPDVGLALAGVTGTNGKTTTAYLIHELLQHAGKRGGLISTVEYRTPSRRTPATHTTPGPETFFELLREIRDDRGDFVAMELSSHALDQGRTGEARFRAAVFTNLTGDHLDYHHTMENYFGAKRRLFTELLAENGTAIINIDDAYGRRLASEMTEKSTVTFGENPDSDCQIVDIELDRTGSKCIVVRHNVRHQVVTPLIGRHNLHNLIGAMLAAEALGAAWTELLENARHTRPVPGRLQAFQLANGATAFVDYAHTDDALTQVLRALRPLTPGRLVALFGCGGDRDRTKRPRMGAAAAAVADALIVTSDNPRSEDPQAIIAEILPGIPPGQTFHVEPDRAAAIAAAVAATGPGDVILIAGKGHEDYQEIAGIRHHFSDAEKIALYVK